MGIVPELANAWLQSASPLYVWLAERAARSLSAPAPLVEACSLSLGAGQNAIHISFLWQELERLSPREEKLFVLLESSIRLEGELATEA